MYDEVIYLVSETVTGTKNEYGDPVMSQVQVQRFAQRKSVGQKEFYQAQTNGYTPEIKFVLPDYLDYDGQQLVNYNNIQYKVLRTFQNESNEIEITCYGGIRNVSA